jgi:hypothetical protein
MTCSNRFDLHIQQGATFHQRVKYKIGGEPVDITEYDIRLQVRKTYCLPPVLDLTKGDGIEISDENVIDIEVKAAQSSAIAPGRYLYDIELSSGSYVERILQGVFTIDGEVTK